MDSLGTPILKRPRIDRLLERIFVYPLTVVRAPMGFGKTTAVREYVQARGVEPIWLSLMGSEGSLEFCWGRLCARVRKRDRPLADRLLHLGFPKDPPQMGRILDLVAEPVGDEGVVLVVDDYDLIDVPEAAQLITLLAGEQLPGFHLVLLCRETSALPVAELEQKRLCWVLGQEELQFRREEIRDYFALMGKHASPETLAQVDQWTGGWITGIYLLLRGLREGYPIGPQGDIDRLLEAGIYAGYDQETRSFLQKLSFLDLFTPEQASYVLGDPWAGGRIVALMRGNAFLSYSRSDGAYQMTKLFRSFLREKAEQDGVDPAPIWRRMGRWFLERDKRTLAYDYLLRADDIETILEDLDRDEEQDIHYGQFLQTERIFAQLPEEDSFRYPIAFLRYLRVKALSAPPEGKARLAAALGELERYVEESGIPEPRRSRILGEIHNDWVIVSFNDPVEMVAHAQQAVDHFQGRYSNVISARTEFTYGALSLLYCYYRTPGQLRQTAEYISTHFHVLARAVEGCGAGSEPLAMAEYDLETGNWEGASLNAQKALHQARIYRQTCVELCALLALQRLALVRGDLDGCDKLLSEAAIAVSRDDSSVLTTTLELCAAYIGCCMGIPEAVPDWLRNGDTAPGNFFFQGMGFNELITARAAMLAGDYIRTEVLCEEAARGLESGRYLMGRIHCHIYAAVAKQKLYGMTAGRQELERALDIAAADQVLLPFAELGYHVLPLLREVERKGTYPARYLGRLIQECEQYERNRSTLQPRQISLSEREGEVLHMLDEGLKHEEIAERLFISVPTVRYHVKNIYGKLEVNNKLAALQKGKSLGLL